MKTFRPNPRDKETYMIDTAGWVAKHAVVSLGPCKCGEIADGVALDLCNGEDRRTAWHPGGVISFADLEAIYLAAKEKRERPSQRTGVDTE